MTSSRELIVLKDVHKYYFMGKEIVKAVDGISFSVKEGEFISIMGASGSGKSTLMNLVGSLDKPTKGKIYLDGKNISNLSESDLAQIRGRKIGFIFQQFNLIKSLTAEENVFLPMAFQNYNSYERKKRAQFLLKEFGLGDRLKFYPSQLSGGQQQLVAITRALANNPEVILADEPTGDLDTEKGKIIMHFLKKLNKQGKTIVLVTHNPILAEKYTKKIYWLKDGKIEKITRPKN